LLFVRLFTYFCPSNDAFDPYNVTVVVNELESSRKGAVVIDENLFAGL
jgi:hypothetical protein